MRVSSARSSIHAFPGTPPKNILDYGAGNGMLSQLLAEQITVANYDLAQP